MEILFMPWLVTLLIACQCLVWLLAPPAGIRTSLAPPPFPSLTDLETNHGLRIHDMAAGEGERPRNKTLVTVEYTVWTVDGRRLESTAERGEPLTFMIGANQVVEGFERCVRDMRVGSRRIVVIPAQLTYTDERVPFDGSGQDLVFDVRIVKFETADAEEAGEPF